MLLVDTCVLLDVLEDEPRPDLDQPILTRPNVTVTSHTAWYSVDSRRELALLCAQRGALLQVRLNVRQQVEYLVVQAQPLRFGKLENGHGGDRL